MELNKIESLAQILNEKGLTALEVEEGNLRIRLEKNNGLAMRITDDNQQNIMESEGLSNQAKEIEIPSIDTKEIVSPLVGVAYLAPSPESEPFVSVGQKVQKGDVLCIIDAMKMLNEIAATEDGTISQICVENGDVVDYGTCLFRLS